MPDTQEPKPSRRQRWVVGTFLTLGALQLLFCGGCVKSLYTRWRDADINYLRYSTEEIAWPASLRVLESDDNGEGCFYARVQLDQEASARLTGSEPFSKSPPERRLSDLDGPWPPAPPPTEFFEAYGGSSNHSWDVILDRRSGQAWIYVGYPDMGGEVPGPPRLQTPLVR